MAIERPQWGAGRVGGVLWKEEEAYKMTVCYYLPLCVHPYPRTPALARLIAMY